MTTKRVDSPVSGFSEDDSAPPSNLSSMQRAIVTIQKLRAKVEALERARAEPIAIIGMACRFPGGANSPEAFFQLLEDGIDAVTEVPRDRWEIDAEQPTDPEARAVRWGAFLRDVDLFDANFFSISPREAAKMDPQQRLLLEVTFEALERAGQVQERLIGSRTGVFLGIMNNDYAELSAVAGAQQEDTYTTTGNGHCFPAGRISYTFGFQGPSIAIDTACSSSLVAVHLACQSLRNGECNMAVAGGVNLMLVPSTSRKFAKTQALSADGRCKSFDSTANGFVRGEGCGMIVLKRLSDAEKDNDPIIGIIRGSAINQDGRSTGLTAPNVLAQQAMLTQALANARVAAADIGYIETHGTGTPLGDPIEMEALKEVLGSPRPNNSKCVLGAVKTNIGHLEAAAGIAGIIKTAIVLNRGIIPRNLHFRTLNPRIRIETTPFTFPEENLPWNTVMKRRVAGISSFGMSGTNAHVILEEWPSNPEEDLSPDDSVCLLPISAKTPEALQALATAYRNFISQLSPEIRLRDVVHSASVRRSHYEHRLSVVGNSREEIVDLLDQFRNGKQTKGIVHGQSTPARAKVVFVFSGQGSQWLGMGRELYGSDSSFRSVIDTCDNLITSRLGWSILDELEATPTTSRMSETQVAQPLLFALQIALVEMLRSWGISPDAMIGHGVGEIAAAHIAGILSLDEAVRLVALRGRIIQKSVAVGKMVSLALPPEEAINAIKGLEERISIAAINDPGWTAFTGQPTAIDEFVARCERQGIEARGIRPSHTPYGPYMDAVETEFIERVARVDTRRATLAMYSTILSECVDGKELDIRYWARNARGMVDFAGAMTAAIRDGYQLFLEIGPDSDLVPHMQHCLDFKKNGGLAVASLQKQRSDSRALLEAAGALYTRGCAIEWTRVVPTGARCVPLPTYPWQRERHWIELDSNAERASAQDSSIATAEKNSSAKVVFVFPGQGSQWPGMARQLLDSEPVFRTTMAACDAAIKNEAGFSVIDELRADKAEGHHESIDIIQPTLFAIEVALAATWRAKGIEPSCVIGHSMGEVAAAHVAGMLSLSDAAKVICQRSRLLKRISGHGAMAVVEMSMKDAESLISGHEQELAVAVSNSARSTVLSGSPRALDEVLARADALGIFNRRIKVDVASHGPQVDPLHADLLSALSPIQPQPGQLRMQSTVTGASLQGSELNAAYWWENLRQPVRFSQVTQELMRDGFEIYLELSPHPILGSSLEENLRQAGTQGAVIASMRRDTDERQTMLDALSALYAAGYVHPLARRQSRNAADQSNDPYSRCIFDVQWKRVDLQPKRDHSKPPATPWLVVGDTTDFAIKLAKSLRERGDRTIFVNRSKSFEMRGPDDFRLDTSDANHWAKFFECANMATGCRGVISCTALDAAPWQRTSEATLAHDLRHGPLATLKLVQSLLKQGWRDAPKLYVLTRGAQSVTPTDSAPSVAQAAVWGMGRVLLMEEPDLGCRRIDLPAEAMYSESEYILRELDDGENEDQVAWRTEGRFVARLERGRWNKAPVDTTATRPLHSPIVPNATYLITGGLGGLGLQLARSFVDQGAESIVLVGRNAPNENARTVISELEARGARIQVMSVDVADRAAVDALMIEIDEQLPPLRGVVHAAVALEDRTVAEMSESTFFHPMAAKVFGGWNLHRATRQRMLDFFVVYSSMAALVGSPGQANYAAANSFLDALCFGRRAEGLPATSIQWGAFADVGLAAASDIRGKRLASRGSESFKPEEEFALFARAIQESRSVIGIMHFDVRQWTQFYPQVAGHPFLSELVKEEATTASGARKHAFRDVLEQVSPKERINYMENHVREQLGQVLRIRPERIEKETPFANLGMDSLMSLELRNKLESTLGLKLSAALLYTYSTAIALAHYLVEQLFPIQASQEAAETGDLAPPDFAGIAGAEQALEEGDSSLLDKLEAFEEYLT